MYRINVKTHGKYHNVVTGYRYCFTKKSAKNMIDLFTENECEMEFEKLIRIHGDVFCWTDEDEDDKVFDYFFERYEGDF